MNTLRETRPTVFFGVPRVYEKIQERMKSEAAQTTGVKKVIETWGKECCLQHHINVMNGYLFRFAIHNFRLLLLECFNI